jgi:hypothetical protein
MSASGGYIKDPAAVLDYNEDWSDWLGTDTIATSTWSVPTGITMGAYSHTTTVSTVWLSGGTAGTNYTVRNTITTVGGRTDVRSVIIKVRSR